MSRNALVTGASRGIGRGIALALAGAGWQIGINYRSNEPAARETAALVRQKGGQAFLVPGDVATAAARASILTRLFAQVDRVDLLVNNAGMAPRQRRAFMDMTEESYDEVMAVNLKGPLFLTQAIARQMAAAAAAGATPGRIVNIGSISGFTSSPSRSEYCISKAGMTMMTALLADCLSPWGINVYEIQPGIIATDMTATVKDKYDTLIADGLTPLPRWGTPEDIGQAVLAVAEGAFPFSTGEVFRVDGGFHLRRL